MDAVLIAGALTREIRQLFQMKQHAVYSGIDDAIRQYRVWPKRQPLVGKALRRLDLSELRDLFVSLSVLDRQAKGQWPGDPWQHLSDLNRKLCGA